PDSAPAPTRLLFFGIVRPYKGLDVLLRALAGAPAHVTLTVAGEFWGDSTEMDNLIAELGLADRVILRPGYVPADQIPALFCAADAQVMPYREATATTSADPEGMAGARTAMSATSRGPMPPGKKMIRKPTAQASA